MPISWNPKPSSENCSLDHALSRCGEINSGCGSNFGATATRKFLKIGKIHIFGQSAPRHLYLNRLHAAWLALNRRACMTYILYLMFLYRKVQSTLFAQVPWPHEKRNLGTPVKVGNPTGSRVGRLVLPTPQADFQLPATYGSAPTPRGIPSRQGTPTTVSGTRTQCSRARRWRPLCCLMRLSGKGRGRHPCTIRLLMQRNFLSFVPTLL